MTEKYRESGRKKQIGGKKREGRTLDCHVKKANIKGKDNRAFDPWLNRALRKSLLYVTLSSTTSKQYSESFHPLSSCFNNMHKYRTDYGEMGRRSDRASNIIDIRLKHTFSILL